MGHTAHESAGHEAVGHGAAGHAVAQILAPSSRPECSVLQLLVTGGAP